MVLGVLPFTVWRELIPAGRWDIAAPRPLVPAIGPQSRRRGFASAGGEHLDWRVVCKDRLPTQNMATNGICQRFQKRGGLADPVGQCRAINVDPVTFEDAALAIEWKMVCVFIDQDMSQQARTGTTTFNWARW